MSTRAAVLGHPISHSLSPVLHQAAYQALGLDWEYTAVDVDVAYLEAFLSSRDDQWGGLSLTMPLKVEAARLADAIEPQARLLGIVNTLIPSGRGTYRQWVGANTDIYGIVAALREGGRDRAERAVVLGGGATAISAAAALGSMGVTHPVIVVRSRARAGHLLRACTAMGLQPHLMGWDDAAVTAALVHADAVVSTVPASAGEQVATRLSGTVSDHATGQISGTLLDVIYDPLVTPLAQMWIRAGGSAIAGTRMLLHQAGEQVRLMTGQVAPLGAMDAALSAVMGAM